ncbi:MAG: CAP domain-containing protein [Acidimicrobiia bacterium]|nr:CAP domain-containing protein [Acidimicrobiia bacterium]MDH5505574.1 CAP domain-containing protein [Acidimicrobiia bacterium]
MRLAVIFVLTIAIAGSIVSSVAASPSGAGTAAPSTLGLAAQSTANPSMDLEFVALLNAERAAAGLNELVPYDDLVDDAALHTSEMLARGDIYHSSDLTKFTTGWQTIGENVGYGPNVEKLHKAFMASPTHRANILGDYDRVGIAAEVDSNGRIYVTVLFMKTLGGYLPEVAPFDLMIDAGVAATLGVGLEP